MNKTNPGVIILRLKDYTNITGKTNEILSFIDMILSTFQIVRNLPRCVDCPPVLKYMFKIICICLDRDPDWK